MQVDTGNPKKSLSTLAMAAALFVVLTGVYTLTYSGTFKSGDEVLFVSGAISLSGWGQLTAGPAGLRVISGNFSEPLIAAVGAGLYQLARLGGVGVVQMLFLTNVYATALTGAVVFLIVRQRGGQPGVAVGVALIFGLGTLAWPHTKLYFRDPLAMLFVALALLSFERLLSRTTWYTQAAQWILTLGLLCAGMLAKNTAAFALVAFLATAAIRALLRPAERRLMVIGLAPLAVVGAVAFLIPDNGGPFSRFAATHYLNWFMRKKIGDTFVPALIGPLLSPGKGVFWEAPALLLALVALPLVKKDERLLHVTAWLTLLGIVTGLAYDSGAVWYGGVGWGVRHVLPAVPLLAAACAPMLQMVVDSRRRWVKWATAFLILVSVTIQVGAVLLLPEVYYGWLWTMKQAPWDGAIWNPLYVEAVGYWRLLLSGGAVDLAWLRVFQTQPLAVGALLVAWLATIALAVAALRKALKGAAPARTFGVSAILAGLALVVLPYGLLRAYYLDPYYAAARTDYREAAQFVTQAALSGDALVVRGRSDPIWKYFANYGYSPVAWYAYNPVVTSDRPSDKALDEAASATMLTPEAEQLLTSVLPQQYKRIWHISDQCGAWADLRLEDRWLSQHYAAANTHLFQDKCTTQVSLYSLATTPSARPQTIDVRFGDTILLKGVAQLAAPGQNQVKPGEVLPLRLDWQLTRLMPVDYNIGVYLLDENGALKAQQDGAARGGFYPMTHWPADIILSDQHALELPVDLPPGDYQVAVAVYNWQTGERLSVIGADGPVPDSLARVLHVLVSAAP